jgi:Lrp/AsnC family transcriptional regulator, leucine-responsive regulatory protein
MLDTTDLAILRLLQQDARMANAEVARRVDLAPSAVHGRIRKLEESGVIRGYQVALDPQPFELGLLAFIFARAEGDDDSTVARIAAIREVLEVHNIAGEDCYLVKVRVQDTEALHHLLRDTLAAIPGLRGTRTTIVLKTHKESGNLPLPGPAAGRSLTRSRRHG